MTKTEYVIIDFETTGLDYTKEQVTEIAAAIVDSSFNVIGTFHTYVKLENGRTLSDYIKKMTGLTDDILNTKGISETLAMHKLFDFIYGVNLEREPIVVAHHVPFDFAFMFNHGILPMHFICTRVLSRLLEPTEKANLAEIAKRLGISTEGHHTAMADVEMTRQILAHHAPFADKQGIHYLNVVVDSSERPLNFIPANATVVKY